METEAVPVHRSTVTPSSTGHFVFHINKSMRFHRKTWVKLLSISKVQFSEQHLEESGRACSDIPAKSCRAESSGGVSIYPQWLSRAPKAIAWWLLSVRAVINHRSWQQKESGPGKGEETLAVPTGRLAQWKPIIRSEQPMLRPLNVQTSANKALLLLGTRNAAGATKQ